MTHKFGHTHHRPKIAFARQMRKFPTTGERVLWNKLRAKQFLGFKFRCQTPIGPFIVDFLCYKKRLIIEVDGDSHFLIGASEYDKQRQKYLENLGFTVIRFNNQVVVENAEFELEQLMQYLLTADN